LNTLLSLHQLCKTFPSASGHSRIRAVENISFNLAPGEVIGIVGESGCGKSTLARLIMCLLTVESGSISFNNQNWSAMSERQLRPHRRQMQMIFQDPMAALDPRLKISTTLEEPLRIHKIGTSLERKKQVKALLEQVGLSADSAERYPHEFSGGQKQRINIARAIALKPKLIVADEPVSALDVSIQSQILNLLNELKMILGLSYLFISHDLAVVKHISDRVAVMYLGEIVELTDTGTLFSAPTHPYTKALISAIPQAKPGVRRERIILSGDVPSPEDPPTGCSFHPRCQFAMASCRQSSPELLEIGSGNYKHQVRCFLA
jgi:oligopeptide/dipeptide ABC transporter ATP-binding protein